ncbi:MAG: hypothetical protein CVV44_11805 [Spirochaetae bacterium HGW-Spirochaetae-1]|jgi:hypothetical protein|nr:MAG: hypothetical protein CVV44_11805 [Spirochaetae bacterium HGW-Spirochaetae-1]
MKKTGLLLCISLVMGLISGCSTNNEAIIVINTGQEPTGRAAVVPSNVTSITVTVSASDIGSLTQTFSAGQAVIYMTAPIGSNRTITVAANINPEDPGALLSYRGSTIANLSPGENNITVNMGPGDTKLMIPEPDPYITRRLRQINDFSSTTWAQLTATDFTNSTVGTFYPWDIDFDRQGRIYIANNVYYDYSQVIRIDNFNALNDTVIVPSALMEAADTKAIAIDRINNILYHSTGSTSIYRVDLNGTLPSLGTLISVTAMLSQILAMAVDDAGMLYIAGMTAATPISPLPGSTYVIIKINPANPAVLMAYYATGLDFALLTVSAGTKYFADIVIFDQYIYVTNQAGVSNNKILKLNKSLELVASYGQPFDGTLPDNDQGQFWGPHHFAAIRSDGIYILDENFYSGSSYDRIVRIDDMDGSGWQVFDSASIGLTFNMYYAC